MEIRPLRRKERAVKRPSFTARFEKLSDARRAGSRTSGADRIAPRRRTASPAVGETSPRCYAELDRKSHKPRRPNRCALTPVGRSRHSEISSHGSLRFFRDVLRSIMVKLRSGTYSACDLTRQPEDARVPVVLMRQLQPELLRSTVLVIVCSAEGGTQSGLIAKCSAPSSRPNCGSN
jgi:hypothetical protein